MSRASECEYRKSEYKYAQQDVRPLNQIKVDIATEANKMAEGYKNQDLHKIPLD